MGKVKTTKTIFILAPIIREKKGTYEKVLKDLKDQGYLRIRVDKKIINLNESEKLDLIPGTEKQKRHSIDVVIDRIILDPENIEKDRIFESVQNALKMGEGLMIVADGRHRSYIFAKKRMSVLQH